MRCLPQRASYRPVLPTELHVSEGVLEMTATGLALLIASFLCMGLILTASLHDIATRTIPNGLVLFLAVAGMATALLAGHFVGSVLSATVIFALAAMCWRRRWMGGGDVKLLGAAALCLPPGEAATFVVAVAFAGGVLALFYLIASRLGAAPWRRRPNGLMARAIRVERWRIGRRGALPYASAIATGLMFVTLFGDRL